MRCNTLLVFVFAAVSAPALAAPLGSADNSFVARNSVEARKLAARGYAHKDASGALVFGPPLNLPNRWQLGPAIPFPTPTSTTSDNVPTQTSTTTDNAPTPTPTVDGTFIHKPLWTRPIQSSGPVVADKVPMLPPACRRASCMSFSSRAMSDDESAASIWGDLWNIGSHVLTSIIGGGGNSQPQPQPQQQAQQDPQQQQVQQRRELDAMYELLARAIDDDESGANFWTNALRFGTQVLAPLLLGNNQPQPQPQPLPAPPVQQSPQPEAQPQQQTQQQRRDIDIVYELLARAADDESGASIWSTLAGFAASLFGGGNQRRDVDTVYQLLARAAAASDSDDESGANFWSDFTNIAGTVASAIFGRDGELLQRREVYELLKRAAEDDESGAGLLDFFSQIFL